MRIAVCENSAADAGRTCAWLRQYCALYQLPVAITCFLTPEAFAARKERFDIVYIGFGGATGFLHARRLREQDPECRIVLMDDTQEFTIQCVRIHCLDFILRPVEFRHIVRSMRLAARDGVR